MKDRKPQSWAKKDWKIEWKSNIVPTAASDYYSSAMVLYEMICHRIMGRVFDRADQVRIDGL
jgi:hypothetical protein